MSVYNTFETFDEMFLEVQLGNVPDSYCFFKQGYSQDIDTGDGECSIWDGCSPTTVTGLPSKITNIPFSSNGVNDISVLSSSNTSDTTVQVKVTGMYADGSRANFTLTLDGQNPLSFPALWRIFELKVVGSVAPVGNVYCSTTGSTLLLGVPQVSTEVRALIVDHNNVSQMDTISVPKGYSAFIRVAWNKAIKSSATEAIGHYMLREYGGVFIVGDYFSLATTGNSNDVRDYPIAIRIPEMTDLDYHVQVLGNNTGISGGVHVCMLKMEELL